MVIGHGLIQSTINRIGFIGNYLPRQCGIATFTTDLCESIAAEYADECAALYDAIGVRIMEIPLTPERVLRALREAEGRPLISD